MHTQATLLQMQPLPPPPQEQATQQTSVHKTNTPPHTSPNTTHYNHATTQYNHHTTCNYTTRHSIKLLLTSMQGLLTEDLKHQFQDILDDLSGTIDSIKVLTSYYILLQLYSSINNTFLDSKTVDNAAW